MLSSSKRISRLFLVVLSAVALALRTFPRNYSEYVLTIDDDPHQEQKESKNSTTEERRVELELEMEMEMELARKKNESLHYWKRKEENVSHHHSTAADSVSVVEVGTNLRDVPPPPPTSNETSGTTSTNTTTVDDTDTDTNDDTPPEEPRTVSIFYNIYIPPTNKDHALAIIEEQLNARRASPAVANSTLYYTVIGDVDTPIPRCDPCEQIGAFPQGNELITLQALYEHCALHPSELVVYIHDKGSYTATRQNDNLRRVLTKAAFSSQCVQMPMMMNSSGSGCNTCAAEFSGLPQPCTPGNMFVAECSYVNRLLSPQNFSHSKESLMREVWAQKNATLFRMKANLNYQFERPSWVGTERFAMEQWVYSHPTVRPCYVYPNRGFDYRSAPADDNWIPRRQAVPRQPTTPIRLPVHPWFKIRGRLIEWQYHYKAEPPKDSWVWQYYDQFLPESRAERQVDMPAINNNNNNNNTEIIESSSSS